MHQYLNRVQSFNASFPADIWIGTGKIVKPQDCREASVGFYKNFMDNMFRTSLEVYYKHMGNQMLFEGELTPVISTSPDTSLVFGEGQSYGAEFYFGKTKGKLTGWLAYTLSYSYQQFDSLNIGNPFPSANDRRHSLYVSANYALNHHWDISSNFVLASGSTFTLFKNGSSWPYDPLFYDDVTGSKDADGATDNRVQNNFRLSPYNRLDISIRYKNQRELPKRVIRTEWVFSVYNAYAHANTYFAYCSVDPVTKAPEAVEVSFVPIIPSLSFYLKF